MTQIQTRVDLLPKSVFLSQFKLVTKHESVEPDLEYAKNYFFELYMASTVYNALLNSSASEQASRMNAMENASSNAGDILHKLTLDYNRARQTKITMELIEIISGASVWVTLSPLGRSIVAQASHKQVTEKRQQAQ